MYSLHHDRDEKPDEKAIGNDNRMGLILLAIAVLSSGIYSAFYFA